jgi:hypothetical protein
MYSTEPLRLSFSSTSNSTLCTISLCYYCHYYALLLQPYMHVDYIPCHTQAELCSKMKALSEGSDAPQFLEATVYSKETAVIMACHFADKPADSALINHVNYFWKPWYYVHVEQVSCCS